MKGKPLIARINASVDGFRGHPELTYQVGVAIPLKLPDENGMPQPEEAEELNQIEDLVFEILEVQSRSVLVAVITTGGMREFVFYAVDPEEVKVNHMRLCQAVTTGPPGPVDDPDRSEMERVRGSSGCRLTWRCSGRSAADGRPPLNAKPLGGSLKMSKIQLYTLFILIGVGIFYFIRIILLLLNLSTFCCNVVNN